MILMFSMKFQKKARNKICPLASVYRSTGPRGIRADFFIKYSFGSQQDERLTSRLSQEISNWLDHALSIGTTLKFVIT
jgi:hypothetical protein